MPDLRILGGSKLARLRRFVALALVGGAAGGLWMMRPCADAPLWNEQNCVEAPFRASDDAAIASGRLAPELALAAALPVMVRTPAVVGPSAQSPDLAWEKEPRNAADLVLTIVRSPADAGAGLFRSVTLNPRDVFVSPGDRERLAAVVAKHATAARRAEAEFGRERDREYAAAMAGGQVQTIEAEHLFGGGLVGPDAFYRMERSVIRAVPRRAMPAADAAQQRLRQLGAEVLAELAATAVDLGMLTAAEQEQLLLRASTAQRVGPTQVPVSASAR